MKKTAIFLPLLVFAILGVTSSALADTVTVSRDARHGKVISIKNKRAVTAKSALVTTATPTNAYTTAPIANATTITSNADRFLSQNASEFGLTSLTSSFKNMGPSSDNFGMTHIRYQQTYKGVPVLGSEVLVHLDQSGIVSSANGKVANGLNLDVTPRISADQALAAAKNIYGQVSDDQPKTGEVRLMIYDEGFLSNETDAGGVLVWEVPVDGEVMEASADYYINALDGSLVAQHTHMRTLRRAIYDCSYAALTGIDSCPYGQKSYDGYTFGRLEGSTAIGPNPYQNNSSDTDMIYETTGLAHNYLLNNFGRDGGNQNGGIDGISSSYYYRTDVYSYYEGRNAEFCNTYGSAYSIDVSRMCHQYTSPDIMGHEYGHAITTFLGNSPYFKLIYSGESGALNESYSDIFGEQVEYLYSGTNDWMNGTDSLGGIVRNLADPNSNSQRFDMRYPDPSRFMSPYVYCGSSDNYGVHYNSTIPSHAAYLASEGGYENGCTITGIGREKMEAIWFQAVAHYYEASETFNQAYQDTIQACTDLATADPTHYSESDCKQVKYALQATEMDQAGYCSGAAATVPSCVCTDSDDGINTTQKGVVVHYGKTYTDKCNATGTAVQEFYCSNGAFKYATKACGAGKKCLDGACINK